MTTPKSAEPGLTDEENEELWRANKWDRTVFGRAAYARGLAAGREADRKRIKTVLDCPGGMCGHCIEVLTEEVPAEMTLKQFCSAESAAIEGGRDELPSVVS